MRDPERISRIILQLDDVWHQYPDMRLGQLIVNLCFGCDPYSFEDNIVEARIQTVAKWGWGK